MKLTKDKYTIQQAAKIIGVSRQYLHSLTMLNPMNPLFVRTEKEELRGSKVILKKELERILLERATIHIETKP